MKQVCKQNSEPGSSSSSIIINLGKSTYCIVFQFPWQCNVDNNSSFSNVLELLGVPCGSAGKESTCNVGNLGLIPGLGRSPAEGKVYPLQYSGLENSMDCIGHGAVKTQTQLSDFHLQNYCKEQKARTKNIFPWSMQLYCIRLPRWLSVKESTCQEGDVGLIPVSGRSPGDGYVNPLQYPCLKNAMDRGTWRATVHMLQKSGTRQWPHTYTQNM